MWSNRPRIRLSAWRPLTTELWKVAVDERQSSMVESSSASGENHALFTPVGCNLWAALLFSRSSSFNPSRRYIICRASRPARQSKFPHQLHSASSAHDRKGRRVAALLPIHGIRKDLCRPGPPSPTVPPTPHGQSVASASSAPHIP